MIFFQVHTTKQSTLDPKKWGQWNTRKEHTSQEIASEVARFYLVNLHPSEEPPPEKLFVSYYRKGDPLHKNGAPIRSTLLEVELTKAPRMICSLS